MFNWLTKAGQKFDLVTVGDTVMDCFIRLEEATLQTTPSGEELCLRFGDKVPYQSATVVPAVGNSANAAVAAARLGLKTAFITNLGADQNAELCLQTFRHEKISPNFIKKQAGQKTNYHYVLWYGNDRTILVHHENYNYTWPKVAAPKWLYLSSLGDKTASYHQAISDYLTRNPSIKLAFQPGTYQMAMGTDQLAPIYQRTEIFFCNRAEAKLILKTKDSEIKNLLAGLKKLGPKVVVITDGPAGAYYQDEAGANFFLPIWPDEKPPVQRTGAGDALAATAVSALCLGKSLVEALSWGPINSASVVQHIGAQAGLLSREALLDKLKQRANDYQAKLI